MRVHGKQLNGLCKHGKQAGTKRGGRVGPAADRSRKRTPRKHFLKFFCYNQIMFKSLPLTVRNVQATEARLQSIYDAAKLGLKGDSLALAAGMLPAEYRQLCQLDPLAEMAEQKGRADNEREISQVLNNAALNGDAKAALEILRHRHEWTAKQEVSVDVYQRISITQALEAAQTRVLENAKNDLYISRRANIDDAVVVTRDSERS
jgi:hypothetical protein